MKTTIEGSALHEAVAWVAKLCPSRPVVPVTAGILLDADTDLTASAFDFDIAGTVSVGAAVAEPGRALVSGRLLAAIAKTVRNEAEIELSCDGPTLQVAAGSSSWSLPCLDERDYPQLPAVGESFGEVDAEELRVALGRVLPVPPRDAQPAVMGGVAVTVDPDGPLTLAATDRYRLVVTELAWQPTLAVEQPQLVVPGELLRTVASMAGSGTVTLASDGTTFSAVTDTHRVSGRLMAEEFVKYGQLLDVETATTITVATAELLRVVERATVMVETYGRLLVDVTGEGIRASVSNEDDSAAEHSCPVIAHVGPAVTVAVNPRYLSDAVTGAGTDTVVLFLQPNTQRPFVVRAADGAGEPIDGYRHLVMTMRQGPREAAS